MIKNLIGKTLTSAEVHDDEEIVFETECGLRLRMYHDQYCCESVMIQSISGPLGSLFGSPITTATEATESKDVSYGSETRTTYTLATADAAVVIRWLGESNGYYSEDVYVKQID